jgi:hypothetical protein
MGHNGRVSKIGTAGRDPMDACESCARFESELHKVKEALRALERSEARGYEYSQEHQRLEAQRESLLEQHSVHQASHSRSA